MNECEPDKAEIADGIRKAEVADCGHGDRRHDTLPHFAVELLRDV